MRKFLCAVALGLVILSISCSKSSGGGGTPPATFQPTTAGSTWNYHDTDYIVPTGRTYTVTATSTDTVARGRTYKKFTNSNGPNQYYAVSGNDYYEFRPISFSTYQLNLDFLYLKNDAFLNENWSTVSHDTLAAAGATVYITTNLAFTVVQVADSLLIDGTMYHNVAKVSTVPTMTASAVVTGIPLPINVPVVITSPDIYYYYARGIGRVGGRFKMNITATPPVGSPINQNINTETKLVSYHIN